MSSGDDPRIGQRLRDAREELGLSLKEVAARLGFKNYQTLSSIEKGKRTVRVSELAALGAVYYRNPWELIDDRENPSNELRFAWRNHEVDSDLRLIEARIRSVIWSYDLLERINDETGSWKQHVWPRFTQKLSFEYIEQLAEDTVRKLDLGFWPGVNLQRVMEEHLAIRVVNYDLTGSGSAVTAVSDDTVTVFVNAADSDGRRSFDLAHELFHIYACETYPLKKLEDYEEHPDYRVEQLANCFASCLLLPESSVLSEITRITRNGVIDLIDLVGMAQQFRVSVQALLWRLKNLNILDAPTVKDTLASSELTTANREVACKKNRPALMFSKRLVRLGLKALQDGKISKGKFCSIFEIARADFRQFLEDRGFSEEAAYNREIALADT